MDDAENAASDSERILDTDLRNIANGLWEAGAEAVAINNQRLTSLSAIRVAGKYPTVNYVTLTPPYIITAIGDPASLGARFLDSQTGQEFLAARDAVGLRYQLRNVDRLELPAVGADNLVLRHAENVPVPGRPGKSQGKEDDK
ncbi:MAG: DUF881 domain-containing protein [Nocardioidaceae bacterium]|nr:MAG: DUF881 domain-containing protein [Nocardioidaceae bacterium]